MKVGAMSAVGAALLALSAAGAWADCAPMTVKSIPGTREAHFTDNDASGAASQGDMRNGEIALQTENGTPVGKEYWLATVQAVDAGGKPTTYDEVQVFVLGDGAIFTANALEPAASYEEPETTIVATGSKRRIVGGTGAYAGAHGTMEMTVDGTDFTYRFEVQCQ